MGQKSFFCFKKHDCNRALPSFPCTALKLLLFCVHSYRLANSWMLFLHPPRTSVSCCQHELEGWELIWPLLILLLSLTRTGIPKMIFRLRLGLTGLDKRSRSEELPGSFSLWLQCVHLHGSHLTRASENHCLFSPRS